MMQNFQHKNLEHRIESELTAEHESFQLLFFQGFQSLKEFLICKKKFLNIIIQLQKQIVVLVDVMTETNNR